MIELHIIKLLYQLNKTLYDEIHHSLETRYSSASHLKSRITLANFAK